MNQRGRPSVLVLSKGLGLGGAEQQIASGSRFWDRDAFEYHVAYVLPWKDHFVADIRQRGFDVTCLGTFRPRQAAAAVNLRRLMRRLRPDLIHAHLPTTGVVARLVGGVPVVYTEHNMVTSYRRSTRTINRWTYGRNAATIAVSPAVADAVSTYPGPEPTVVMNGVAVEVPDTARSTARAELGVEDDTPLIVHVGNIRPGKGHDNLVEAVRLIHEKHPEVVVASIGGEKIPGSLGRLRAEVADAGLTGVLHFMGSRSDALTFVAASDLFVNPSDVEGLPVAILEAMALARPVVATDVGGVGAVVRTGETGYLVPAGDPRALATAVVAMLDDPNAARELGEGGAELVERKFAMREVVAANEQIYRKVLDA